MKLHLPKVLFAAVMAVLGVQYSGAAVTTEVKSGENAIVIGTGESAKTYDTTLITGNSNTGIKLTGNGAISLAEGTILGFGMTSSTPGTDAPGQGNGNFFSANYTYNSDILVYDSDTTDSTDMGLVINNGNTNQVVAFGGKVSGNGVISIVSSAPTSGITLKFTGDMSDYTGTMKGDCANKFAFEGATTGTGTIVSNGAISMNNTVINNSSISTTNTLSIAGTTSITSALTLTATKLEISKALNVSAEGASITFGANTTLSLKVADLLAGNYTGTVKYDNTNRDTAGSGYLRVENLELFTDYSKVSGANIQVEVSGSTTEVTPSTKVTYTFNGAYGIASDATYTADVMGNAKTLILDNSATLTLTETPTAVTGIIVKGADTKLNLSGKTTEISAVSLMSEGKTTLKGDGKYNLGKVAENAISAVLGTGDVVKLDTENWTGTVSLYGGRAQTGTSLDKCVKDINFNAIGHAGSKVEIASQGLYGYLEGKDLTFAPDIELTGNLVIQNGSSGKKYTFDGKVFGNGNLNVTRTAGGTNDYTFTNDISGWKGELNQSGDETTNVTLTGKATTVNAAIKDTGSGTLNLKVGNTGKKTTFTNTVTVDSISVDAGNTMSLGGTTTTASLTLGEDAIIDFVGGTLNVTGSLTLAAADVTVSKLSSYFNAETLSATLVTTSGEGNTLTVNDLNTWTGGAYSIDGQHYTTSLSVEGNSLKLNFTLETLDVYVTKDGSVYAGGTLTLAMVDANGNRIDKAADNYNVIGLYGGAEWDAIRDLITDGENPVAITLQGAEGFTIVGSGDTDADPEVGAGNVSFYGKYYGEYNANSGAAGSYNPNYIPEPASATLGLAALMMLATRRRRKA